MPSLGEALEMTVSQRRHFGRHIKLHTIRSLWISLIEMPVAHSLVPVLVETLVQVEGGKGAKKIKLK